MGKSTMSMAIFNSLLYVYQRVNPLGFPVEFPTRPSVATGAHSAHAADDSFPRRRSELKIDLWIDDS